MAVTALILYDTAILGSFPAASSLENLAAFGSVSIGKIDLRGGGAGTPAPTDVVLQLPISFTGRNIPANSAMTIDVYAKWHPSTAATAAPTNQVYIGSVQLDANLRAIYQKRVAVEDNAMEVVIANNYGTAAATSYNGNAYAATLRKATIALV